MAKSDSLILLLLVYVTSCIADGHTNPFDIGAAFDCALPQGNSGACTVDYEVPAAVAHHRIFAIKQGMVNISTDSTGGESAECKSAINRVQCARNFPRCTSSEGRVSVIYSAQACSQVEDTCSDDAADKGSCEFTLNSTHNTCKTVAQFVAESQMPLSACNKTGQDSNWYVTEWMFAYLRDIDEQLTLSYEQGLNLILDKECFEKYAQFRCQSVGRCWDKGQRIEIHPRNIMSNCQEILNCASNLVRTLLSNQLLCHLWPDIQTLPTPTSSNTPTTATDTTTNNPTTTPTTDSPSGAISRHFISLSILSITVIVTALGACL